MTKVAELVAARYGTETAYCGDMEADGAIRQILSRGSQRHFTDQPVPDDLLKVLLACAQSAPAKSDLQQYSIVVVRDATKLKALGEMNTGMDWPTKAPVFLAFCADMRRIQRLAAVQGHDHQNNNLDTFMNGVVDASLAMLSFMYAAEGEGLGCCPISQIRNQIDVACEIMELPPGVFPIAGFAVGWPKYETPRVSMRLPQETVVHWDSYDDGDLESQVEDYGRRRHDSSPIGPDKQRHTDKYGVLDFCPWAENVTRQLSLPERAGFAAFLKKHGYDLA
ncbi:MAG: NADPH-dependent oxidoreductase [Rhodospirillaceae bacterium]|nr:NADPH-dependent oxidoreductase [Rhodospirillaceae bacterium]MBL25800.1 NADPH-dependent oxidoreductase [Rhodospirillaceae bacterium]